MSLKVSKKYIINIYKFMENYLGIKYTGKNKLTHKEMNIFLIEKKKKRPCSIDVDKIKKEDILKGHCIMVMDCCGRIIPYLNSNRIELLMPKLEIEKKRIDLNRRREEILNEKPKTKKKIKFMKKDI